MNRYYVYFLFFIQGLSSLVYGASNFAVTSKVESDWNTGCQVSILIKNTGTVQIQGWSLEFDFLSTDQKTNNLWGGVIDASSKDSHIKVTPPTWYHGGYIDPNGVITIGIVVTKNAGSPAGVKNIVFTPQGGAPVVIQPFQPIEKKPLPIPAPPVIIPPVQNPPVDTKPLPIPTPTPTLPAPVAGALDYKPLQEKIWKALLAMEQKYNGTAVAGLLVDDYGDVLHSEGVGYGMLIAVADNDKATFLKYVTFMAARLDKYGLMNWNIKKDGSIVEGYNGHYAATDGDEDIMFAMIHALKKWPEIGSQTITATMIGFDDVQVKEMAPVSKTISILDLAKQQMYSIWEFEVNHSSDPVTNFLLLPGDGFGPRPFGTDSYCKVNVSYFRPSYMGEYQDFYQKYLANSFAIPPLYSGSPYKSGSFAYNSQKHDWGAVKKKMYEYTLLSMQKTAQGLPPAWSHPVTAEPTNNFMTPDFQYDSVRVLQFVGMDYLQTQNAQAKKILEQIMGYYADQLVKGVSKGAQGNMYKSFPFPVTLQAGSPTNLAWVKGVVLPPTDIMYRFPAAAGQQEGPICCNPANTMIAVSLMIGANVLGVNYKALEKTCYDYFMSQDGAVTNGIAYFAGSLTVIGAQFIRNIFPYTAANKDVAPLAGEQPAPTPPVDQKPVVVPPVQNPPVDTKPVPTPSPTPTPPASVPVAGALDYKPLQEKIWKSLLAMEQKYNGTAVAGLLVDDYGDVLHSEGVGYGMLIAVADNDKMTFLKYVTFMAARLDKYGLMNWNIKKDGSIVEGYNGHYAATDGDEDIMFAMIHALKKWPEIGSQKITATMIGFDDAQVKEMAPVSKTITILDLAKQQLHSIWEFEVNHTSDSDTNLLLLPGDGFGIRPFGTDSYCKINVSYFRPSYMGEYQDFYEKYLKNDSSAPILYSTSPYTYQPCKYNSRPHDWAGVKKKMYDYTLSTMQKTSLGLPPAWSHPVSDEPTNNFMTADFQYDSVRVLQFVGMDYKETQNAQAKKILEQIMGYYADQLIKGVSKGAQGNMYKSFPFPVTLQAGSPAGLAWVKGLVLPPADIMYRFPDASMCCNPANTMIAVSLMIAANALGANYKALEKTCYDYFMSQDSAVTNGIAYFAGSLTVMAAQFMRGIFPIGVKAS